MVHIYKITNLINNKLYIGKTSRKCIEQRWKEHCKDSKRPYRCDRPLYRAMNKYGVENFKIELLETVENDVIACEKEMYYIQLFNTYHYGYNATLGGDGKAYVEINDDEICNTYKEIQNIAEIKRLYKIDIATIKKILARNNIKIIRCPTSNPVAQIDKETNRIINVYPSLSKVKRNNPNIARSIDKVCRGIGQTAGGYKWSFVKNLSQDLIDTYYDNKKYFLGERNLMKNILIIVENPSIANKISEHCSCCCIQPVFSVNTEVSVAENSLSSCGYKNNENGLVPLELNFFKNAKDAYMVLATSDKVDCDTYDCVLFATKKTDTAFYGIVEFCERNNVLIDKILYKEHSFDTEEDYNNVMDIEGVQHFFDMSIDDFVA